MKQTIPVKVRVGLISHMMEKNHYIDSIELQADGKSIGKIKLDPVECKVPEVEFLVNVDKGMKLEAIVHCNVDGEFESSLTLQ